MFVFSAGDVAVLYVVVGAVIFILICQLGYFITSVIERIKKICKRNKEGK